QGQPPLSTTSLIAVGVLGAGLQPLVLPGTAVPGGGESFGPLLTQARINAHGEVAFSDANLTSGATTLWLFNGDQAFTAVARVGDLVPGIQGARYGEFLDTLSLNDQGDCLFGARLTRSALPDYEGDTGLFLSQSGETDCVARFGVVAPG